MKRTSLFWFVLGIALLLLAACGGGVPAEVATVQPAATAEVAPTEAEIAPTDPPATAPPDTATPLPPTATLTPEPTEPPTVEPSATPVSPAATPTEPPAIGAPITIEDFLFTPGRQTVRVGDTVTWTHVGNARHTVTADDGSFDSGSLSNGGSFSFTFDATGTYAYYCRLHGASGGDGMAAVITVTE